MTSLNTVSTLFGGTAPHGLKELYGELFSDGTSAPASGAINLRAFNGKSPTVEADGTWTHIAVPYYYDGILQIQSLWRINTRVGTETSLYTHGPPLPNSDWPSTILTDYGYITPTQWYNISGGGNPPNGSNPGPIGVIFQNSTWIKTINQTS